MKLAEMMATPPDDDVEAMRRVVLLALVAVAPDLEGPVWDLLRKALEPFEDARHEIWLQERDGHGSSL